MKKIKLNKKLFLNKDVVSNLNGVQGGVQHPPPPAVPDNYPSAIQSCYGLCGPTQVGGDDITTEIFRNYSVPTHCFVGPPDPPTHACPNTQPYTCYAC